MSLTVHLLSNFVHIPSSAAPPPSFAPPPSATSPTTAALLLSEAATPEARSSSVAPKERLELPLLRRLPRRQRRRQQ